MSMKGLCSWTATFLSVLMLDFTATAAAAETRGYVISWFATATFNDDIKAGCPSGKAATIVELHARELVEIGFTIEQANEILQNSRDSADVVPEYKDKIYNRALFKGKNVSIFNYPEQLPDPNIETYVGQYAYGFDLSGRQGSSKFEDPQTHQPVDNQLWRAVGCLSTYLATPPQLPYIEDTHWNVIVDHAPAWTIHVTGDDLSKDGKVSITFSRATQHLTRDAANGALWGATYVIDPNMTSHNVLDGEIRDGILTITPKDSFYLQGQHPFYTEIDLKNVHLRIQPQADGRLVGYLGGYLDWQRYAYMYTSRGSDADVVGIYHTLKKMADAGPDPKSGQNSRISGTFRLEAVPAFIADSSGKILATPMVPAPQ
jgi:hypothetical protein